MLGRRFRSKLAERLARTGWEARGQGSLCRLFLSFTRNDAEVIKQQNRLWWALYDRGIFIAKHGVAAISTVMDGALIDRATDIITDAVDHLP